MNNIALATEEIAARAISDTAEKAYVYAKQCGCRCLELEPLILKDIDWVSKYARDVIKGRWPEAEPAIALDGMVSFWYSTQVVKGRWLQGEAAIKRLGGHLWKRYTDWLVLTGI